MRSIDSSCAGRMKLHVFTTTTSACSADVVAAYPARASVSAMPSPSTRFLGQPRFSMKKVRGFRMKIEY
jgi:hypothetical protein